MSDGVKPEWQDATTYFRDETNRQPRAWSLDLGRLRVVVTSEHIHHKGEWIMHCHPFFSEYELTAKTAEQAQRQALQITRREVDRINTALKLLI